MSKMQKQKTLLCILELLPLVRRTKLILSAWLSDRKTQSKQDMNMIKVCFGQNKSSDN